MANTINFAVAQAIQKIMGDGWTVRRLTDDGKECWWGEVSRTDGMEIHISHDTYKKKLSLSVRSPREGYVYNELLPDSITVADSRAPDSIAKDFARRILPMAQIFWQDECDRIEAEANYDRRLEIAYARLAAAGSARPYTRTKKDPRPTLNGDRWRTKYPPNDKDVTIELDLNIDTAVKLLEWFEQNRPAKKEY